MSSESLWVASPELPFIVLTRALSECGGTGGAEGLPPWRARDLAGASPYGARRWPFPTAINWLEIPHGWVVGTRARPAGCLPVRFCRKHRKQKKPPPCRPATTRGSPYTRICGPKGLLATSRFQPSSISSSSKSCLEGCFSGLLSRPDRDASARGVRESNRCHSSRAGPRSTCP